MSEPRTASFGLDDFGLDDRRLYMYLSPRSCPTACQLRSSPSRWKPARSAVRQDCSFDGSM
jgi:hypothetical protein